MLKLIYNKNKKEVITIKLHFIKVNPVENMTVFILESASRQFHINVANKIMEYGSPHAEQVEFIEKPCTEEGKGSTVLGFR
ncbi:MULTISPECIES: hypothetical protein [unclassified Clostridium]|nr:MULTISPECIES: hypothetical protein [unclassified Clostridium]